jgi:hypothetical protein
MEFAAEFPDLLVLAARQGPIGQETDRQPLIQINPE